MNNIKEKYEKLYQFFSCYFTEDFFIDFGEPELAIAQFIKDSNSDGIKTVICQLREILNNCSESELDAIVYRLGCCYSPQKHRAMTINEWVNQVILQIEGGQK
jgi:hypothetical protein